MQLLPTLGAGAALAVLAWPPFPLLRPTAPPAAEGHYVLVVEGDRTQLAIAFASRKQDPFGGVPKGLESPFHLTVRDAHGAVLADVPLDVSAFATGPAELARGVRVEGCIVRDPRINMLVNVPRFAQAASYTFSRRDGAAAVAIGEAHGEAVRQLAGEGR